MTAVGRAAAVRTIVGHSLRESLRRRVFLVVLVLTAAFLALYGWGAHEAFEDVVTFSGEGDPFDAEVLAGSTLVGLAMFATLFLGAVLAVFLTLGAVRGDAERGLLQPIVVRPIGRLTFLAARYAGAVAVCGAYVAGVFAAVLLITRMVGDYTPDRIVVPGLSLMGAVAVIAAISLLGSVYLSATANGIAVFMIFGAGLTAGLLGQIGEALQSDTLEDVGRISSLALPFEALYQAGLGALTADTGGLTGVVVELGPFGGAQEGGPLLVPWAVLFVGLVGAIAARGFARRDL